MVFVSSVKMAFSTNFISASCVKLNKFNFVIFFKKVTGFILIMFTVILVEWIFHWMRISNLKWQDYLIWIILLVLIVGKCLIFVFEGKKGWVFIKDHLISLSKWRYLHFTGVLNVTPCAFHIWESSSRLCFAFKKNLKHTIGHTLISFSFRIEVQIPSVIHKPVQIVLCSLASI